MKTACTATPTSKSPAKADARFGRRRLLGRLAAGLGLLGRLAAGLGLFGTLTSACASLPRQPDAVPTLILLSFDGWRWDYTDRAEVPHLRALAARGVRSEGLVPAFPSKTFPNHYTIVTGRYPAAHGIIANNMWDDAIGERFTMSADTAKDPRWWGGEPLWATAERQGRPAASMFWPGSDVEIGGRRPSDWRPYDHEFPNEQRVAQVLTWLARPEAERPAFITLYFSDVDSAGHTFGPDHAETLAAAASLDVHLGDLIRGIDRLGLTSRTNVIVVSDHGMSQQAVDRKIFLDDYVDLATVRVVDWSPVLHIAPLDGDVEALYRKLHGRHPALAVYRRGDLPARLRFSGHPRIQPIIALADDGWAIMTRERFNQNPADPRLSGGDHGYEGRHRSMHGLFVAAGPAFREGARVPAFESVHLYELMCSLIGVAPARNDGDPSITRRFLR
jgi:predicted AlkP superfamily pyrophosphatase or phosphodiesterase